MLICCAEWFATREMSRTLASVSAFQTTGMMVMFLVVVRFVCSAGVDDVLMCCLVEDMISMVVVGRWRVEGDCKSFEARYRGGNWTM
jgi:hypothetical protein